jgi:glycosyltransferase involved in cell wall biosynthesis
LGKVILFYSSFAHRSRDTESVMIALRKKGHRVISLSQESGMDIHEFLNTFDVETCTHVLPGKRNTLFFLRQLIFFVKFCRKHHVDKVFSHLEQANYVASLGQYFIGAQVFLCRHHINEAALYGFDRSFYYKLTYTLARRIIVVSERARQYMIDHEKIPASKIIHINLAYDFSLYRKPDMSVARSIRKQYEAELLVLTICRLTKYKRPELSIHTLQLLVDRGIDAKLIVLGKGELESVLMDQIRNSNLSHRVFLLGHVPNTLDYLQAADYLLHPSTLDSSCVVVKEAGLVQKPVIVCEGVGDFDDYIENDVNGVLVSPENYVEEAARVIQSTRQNEPFLHQLGARLRADVLRRFDIAGVLPEYLQIVDN